MTDPRTHWYAAGTNPQNKPKVRNALDKKNNHSIAGIHHTGDTKHKKIYYITGIKNIRLNPENAIAHFETTLSGKLIGGRGMMPSINQWKSTLADLKSSCLTPSPPSKTLNGIPRGKSFGRNKFQKMNEKLRIFS